MPSLWVERAAICPDGPSPAAVEKIEQASSAMIFSGTARRWGQMLPQATFEAHLCAVRIWIFRPRKI